MENYRASSHCTYDIKYHIVWITKYRKPILTGKIAQRTRDIIRQVCSNNDVEILSGHVGKDHIHLLVSVPPHLSASRLVQYLKGSSASEPLPPLGGGGSVYKKTAIPKNDCLIEMLSF